MARGATGLVLLSAWFGLAAGVRAQDRPLLLPPAPVKSTANAPIRPVSHDETDLPPHSGPLAPRAGSAAPLAERADYSSDPPPRKRAAGLARPEGARSVPADLVESTADRRRDDDRKYIEELFDRRSDLGRGRGHGDRDRSAAKFGDRLGTLFNKDPDQRGWFCSDHGFDQFASPITNPFLFEDPRALTEIRPVFIYQAVPNDQPNFQGGSLWFFGARGSVAFTERLSVTLNKLGGLGVYPRDTSPYDDDFGFAELWLGPKVTIIRDPEFGSILSAGAVFQIPVGSASVFQDTGELSIAPYLSGGQTFFRTRLGSLNGLATAGYSISINRERSDYVYVSGHLDYDVCDWHRFYPVVELNWFQYTTDGQARFFSGEGRDLINFGSQSSGSNLLTWAIGGRVKVTESAQIGAAFEMPLLGNKDLFDYRFTVDFVLRY